MLAVIIFLLAFTSILGNYYYGETNLSFITSNKKWLQAFRFSVIAIAFLGCIASADLIWNLADGIMGLMALVDLTAIALLSPIAFKLIKDYASSAERAATPSSLAIDYLKSRMSTAGKTKNRSPAHSASSPTSTATPSTVGATATKRSSASARAHFRRRRRLSRRCRRHGFPQPAVPARDGRRFRAA